MCLFKGKYFSPYENHILRAQFLNIKQFVQESSSAIIHYNSFNLVFKNYLFPFSKLNSSMGIGNIIVELLTDETVARVCR